MKNDTGYIGFFLIPPEGIREQKLINYRKKQDVIYKSLIFS